MWRMNSAQSHSLRKELAETSRSTGTMVAAG